MSRAWGGMEVRPVNRLTQVPRVKIDRVQVRYYETVQNEAFFVVEGSRTGDSVWYPLCEPTKERHAAWMEKEAFERLFRAERTKFQHEQEKTKWEEKCRR